MIPTSEVKADLQEFISSSFTCAEVIVPDDTYIKPSSIANKYKAVIGRLCLEISVKRKDGHVFLIKHGTPTREVKVWMRT